MPKSAKAKAEQHLPPPLPEPLAVPVTDSHTHLDMQDTTVEEALTKAAAVGVTRVVQIGCDVARARWAAKTAAEHEAVWAAVALHPNEAARIDGVEGAAALDAALAEIAELAGLHQVRALGETGLDYYRTGPEGTAAQQRSFRRHIALAKELDKTLVIHDRDAHDDVLRILREEGAPGGPSSTATRATSPWPNSAPPRGTSCPSPAMSPSAARSPARRAGRRPARAAARGDRRAVPHAHPFRGRPNASYLIPVTLRAMAEVKGLSEEELSRHIAANTVRAFG